MTWFRWWHKHIRLHFRQKASKNAEAWTHKLTLLYAFLAWNALGLAGYLTIRKYRVVHELTAEEKLTLTRGEQYAKEYGRENLKIIRLKGLDLRTKQQKSNEDQGEPELLSD